MKESMDPQKIYEDCTNHLLSEDEAAKKLIKIIQNGSDEYYIELSIKLLKSLIIESYDALFIFTMYDLVGWTEDPIFESVRNELFNRISAHVWEFMSEGIAYEEAIILALYENLGYEKLIKVEDINTVFDSYPGHYKISEDGHVLGLYLMERGDPGHIPFIPENIYRLRYLEEFYIFNCELELIPEAIGRLKSLRILILGFNLINELPPSIGNLTALEELTLSHNYIEILPESMGSLRSLRRLDLSENNIEFVPDTIRNLPCLEELRL